jgi:hypothetical protein
MKRTTMTKSFFVFNFSDYTLAIPIMGHEP